MKTNTESKSKLKKLDLSNLTPELKPIAEVKPYWRNPRDHTDSMEIIKQSLIDNGFTIPLIVEKDGTIVVGHGRYKAAVELGYTELPVIVWPYSKKQAKKYRIQDNKTSEHSRDKHEELLIELREIGDISGMQPYFPRLDLNMALDTSVGREVNYDDQESIDRKKDLMDARFTTDKQEWNQTKEELICPHCGETFFVSKNAI